MVPSPALKVTGRTEMSAVLAGAYWSVPPPNLMAELPRLASEEKFNTPPLTNTPPVKVFAVATSRVPEPLLVRLATPPMPPAPEKVYDFEALMVTPTGTRGALMVTVRGEAPLAESSKRTESPNP